MFNPIEEIKNRLDIVEVIGSYIKLQKVGTNYRALCPFHSEKKPSFFVSPSRQMWHCFGACSEGGDIFKFVMKIEGVEFGDALRILARRAGVELKKQDPRIKTKRQRFYEICELAALFFERQLESSKRGQSAKKYLLSRGISNESIKKWRLGYAPDVWQGLSDFLVGQGYQREEVEKAGLAIKKEGGGWYDRFRGRIMFPIFDLSGQIVGFTGRIFGDTKEVAKYVNTPNTLLYDKSRILYGLDKAKMAIRSQDRCILVEGQTDVILSHQAGVENVVATSGTALTPYQLGILKRYSENLVTAFDMDVAGDSATKRGIDLALSQEFNVRVITMPEGKDPADIVLENPEQWKDLTGRTKSILDFYFESTFSKHNSKTAEGKKEISKILLPIIKKIPNRIEQAHWVQKLAQKLEVKEECIEVEMKKLQGSKIREGLLKSSAAVDNLGNESGTRGGEEEQKSRKEKLEERVISLILKRPQSISLIRQEFLPLFSARTREVLTKFQNDPNFFEKEGVSSETKEFLNTLSLKAEIEESDVEPEKEIQFCLKEIRLLEIKKQLDEISLKIRKAEQENDLDKVNSLTAEFQNLSRKLKAEEDE